MIIIKIFICSIIIISIHELGHYLVLRMFDIPIYNMGISCRPMPHFFIRYKWPRNIKKHCLIIMSGSIMTILGIVILSLTADYQLLKYAFYAYFAQIILETNPFFSDFLFASVVYRNKLHNYSDCGANGYQSKIKEYLFSNVWYIHFALWFALAVFLIKQIEFEYLL